MFVTKHIGGQFKKGALKILKTDQGPRRVAEALIEIEPLTEALARELGEDIAGHLFDDSGVTRPELESIDLHVDAGLQKVTAALNPDLDPVAELAPASVKDVTVARQEDEKLGQVWLKLSLTIVFSLEEKGARDFVLDNFGKVLYWTFERINPTLGLGRPPRTRKASEGDRPTTH